MSEDNDYLSDEFENRLRTEGTCVATLHWRGDTPLAGDEFEQMFKLDGQYFSRSEWREWTGPHDSLNQALEEAEFFYITETTVAIDCSELDDIGILNHAVFAGETKQIVRLNGKPWQEDEDGAWQPVS